MNGLPTIPCSYASTINCNINNQPPPTTPSRKPHLTYPDSHVRPRDADERAREDRKHAEHRHTPPSPQRRHPAVVGVVGEEGRVVRVVQPEEAREAVRVPRRKQRGGDSDQVPAARSTSAQAQSSNSTNDEGNESSDVRENRHRDAKDECNGNGARAQADPHRPTEQRVLVQVIPPAEEADEDELGGRVRVERAGEEEVAQADAEGGCVRRRECGQLPCGRAGGAARDSRHEARRERVGKVRRRGKRGREGGRRMRLPFAHLSGIENTAGLATVEPTYAYTTTAKSSTLR